MGETLNSKGKTQFRIELILALIITGLACAAGFSNLLFESNSFFPQTSDGMGHMAKVRYLAECLSKREFPSWFPYWYNGSTFTQYYPPLSYWILAPIYIIAKNAMLVFKIYCFMMIFVGGIGVWYFCRVYIGRWCGLFGSITYCLQPFILRALLSAGAVAQGPIIALTPWYLIALLSFGKNPTPRKFIPCTILCALMILGHPNTTFMMCFCIVIVLFVFVLLRKITLQNYFYIILSIIFAGILTAFWSLVGVTGLENPGIPYLLQEAAINYSATFSWFTSLNSGYFFFAIPVSVGSIIATIIFAYRASYRLAFDNEWYYIFFSIIITLFTIIFSFGLNLPIFEYLPLAGSLVAGRILALTSTTGAILCAYLIFMIQRSAKEKRQSINILAFITCFFVIGAILFYMNPYKSIYHSIKEDSFSKMFPENKVGSNFEKGRYTYIGAVDCSETYFPISHDYNISDGWNIEGTPHNRAIWNHILANPSDNFDYVAKNLAFWNVRFALMSEEFETVADELEKDYDFKFEYARDNNNFYISDAPSSYFLTDKRNALILGAGSPGLAIEFPYLVYEQRDDITDYSLKELEKYRVIYLCEPAVETLQDKKNIEAIVEELIDRGIIVIIEPTIAKGYAVFNVAVSDVLLEDSPIIKKQSASQINSSADNIEVDESMKFGRAMFGLDEVYYRLVQNNDRLGNDIIGAKKVGDGEVVFIGKHLSQYLKAVYARNWGVPDVDSGYPECSDEVKALFEDIFSTYGVNKDFWPDPFSVNNAKWNYKGVDFDYTTQKAQEMTLSVTYAPRWKATLDGKPIEVGQRENLITLDLPAGDHGVKLVYGLTKYGIAGYVISFVGLLLFILFIVYYDIILYRFRQICIKTGKFLQLNDKE